MSIDALAKRLQVLISEGVLNASELTEAMRARLWDLFALGVLEDVKARGKAGRRVVANNGEALRRWVERNYPSGLTGHPASLSPRAAGVANFRDSKRGGRLEADLVFLRGFGSVTIRNSRQVLPLGEMTAQYGVVGQFITDADPWRFSGTVLVVENGEVFLHAHEVLPPADVVVHASGRISERLVNWFALQDNLEVIHAGDYDAVGLADYLRLKHRMPGRVRLFIPPDLDVRVEKFGNREILEKSVGLLMAVRNLADEAARQVLESLDRHARALEQEYLLIPMGS